MKKRQRLRLQAKQPAPAAPLLPNRFMYYVVCEVTFEGRTTRRANSIVLPFAIDHSVHIDALRQGLAGEFKGRDGGGATVIGSKPEVVVTWWQFLRAWWEEETAPPADPPADAPPAEGAVS